MRPLPRRERLRPQLLRPSPFVLPTARPQPSRLHSLSEEEIEPTQPAPASPADLRISYPTTPSPSDDATKYTKLDDIFQSAEKEYQRLRSIVEAPSLFDETLYDSDATVRVDEAPSRGRVMYGRVEQEEEEEEADILSPIPISTAKSLLDELGTKESRLRVRLRERCDSDATVRPDADEDEEADVLSPIPISTAAKSMSLFDELLTKGTQLRVRERCDSDATVRPDDFEPRSDALWSLVRKTNANANLNLGSSREARGRYDSDATVRQ